MVGAFMGYGVLSRFGGPLARRSIVAVPLILLMFAAAMARLRASSASSIERFAYRPLRNAPRIAPLISALGVSFFLENSVLLLTHGQRYNTLRPARRTSNGQPRTALDPAFSVVGRPVTVVQRSSS